MIVMAGINPAVTIAGLVCAQNNDAYFSAS